MKVSIVIPIHNSAKTIKQCLISIFKTSQKLKSKNCLEFEVIVVDDGSTDNSVEIVKNYPVTLLKQKKEGPAAARNLGAKHSKYDTLLFLDSDVILMDDTFQEIIKSFSNDKVDAVCGRYYKESLNRGFTQHYKALIDNYFFRNYIEGYEKFDARIAAIKKDVFFKAGLFNTQYKNADCENEEFGYRISKNFNIVLNPKIQVMHHFPGFKRLARNYYRRAYMWLHLFIIRKKFDSSLTTFDLAISTASVPFIVSFTIFGSITPTFFYIALSFFACFIIPYLGFYLFVLKEKGFLLTLFAVLMNFVLSIILCASMMVSLLNYSRRKIEVKL